MPDTVLSAIESLLQDSSLCSQELGGLEFYGYSKEFRELLQLCGDFATAISAEKGLTRKAYVFLDEYHGKSSLAKAIAIQTEANGGKVFRFDGTIGSTSRDLKDLQRSEDALIIIDDLPEAAANRSTVLERINSLKGRAVLLARPEYANDGTLRPDTTTIRMAHVDERHVDKVAWLVGLVREQVRDEGGVISEALANVITRLPVNLLATLCSVRLGRRVSELESLARKIAQAIQLSEALRPGNPLPDEELAAVFAEFYSAGADKTDSRFRLWVEGESDCRMLKLACLLALPVYGLDLGEGLAIIPLGTGRDGGTSKATEVVVRMRTKRNRDIFLFDLDDPGRHAKEALETLGQEVIFLDPEIACSRVEPDVEIEDFISLGCLDRFYSAHPDLRPEKEIIRYKPPVSRRIVVDGAHKEQLTQWMEVNAGLADVENLVFVLCDVRNRFSLRSLPTVKDKDWRRRLIEETIQDKRVGNRSSHWTL